MSNPTHLTRLSFGRAIPTTDTIVTDDEIDTFIVQNVARRFPAGFTVIHADGGWQDESSGETIREPTFIVEIAHSGTDEEHRAIRALARTYKLIFHQDAVMATTVPATVEFI